MMKKSMLSAVLGITLFILPTLLYPQTKEITLQDIYTSGKFRSKGVYGLTPMKDGEHYCILENDSINIYSYQSGEKTGTLVIRAEMIPQGDSASIELNEFTFSQDEKKLLIPAETESIYRYSSVSNYYIWDLTRKKCYPLSTEGKQRLADFSPDGTKVAFVRDNNLFIKDLTSDTEFQVTTDGLQNNIINGTTDWVYEEEFAITKGFYWSPDGKKIAFYRFDESKVKEFSMMEWGELYPEIVKFKYPKAGEDNSAVTVHIYGLATREIVNVDVGPEKDQYIPRIMWTKDTGKLALIRMNRLQNYLELLVADATTGNTTVIFDENNEYYISDGDLDHFIIIDHEKYLLTCEKDGYTHIWMHYLDGRKGVQLTRGQWDVTAVYGYDEANGLVWFQTASFSPLNREIYTVDLKGRMNQVSDKVGSHKPEFSPTFKYYIDSFSDADSPPVYTVNRSNGTVIRTLEDNKNLQNTIREYGFGKIEFFKFTTSEGVELNGYKLLPPNFDPAKKYPVFMDVYGGPGSQTVLNSWGICSPWSQMLAQKGYIIASVDNRGTGARGEEFRKMTYQQLGKYETIDQIEAAKYLGRFPYVDSTRIGIWGWSYGGYMSALCITKGADVFKAAIAVAPITNWRYYDNIYTERYMRKPQDNAQGYDDNSPINHVDKLKGKFLVIHGTGDDNVHVQNTMDLASALVKANKQFEMFLYPNKNHGIYGGSTRINLYTRMTDFILGNL